MEDILDKCDRIAPSLIASNFVVIGKRTGIVVDVEDTSQVILQLVTDGFLKLRENHNLPSNQLIYDFTYQGREFFKEGRGGYRGERERKALSEEKLKTEFLNSKRVYKTYPYTQFISWVSFVIAVLLGFLKLVESLKI